MSRQHLFQNRCCLDLWPPCGAADHDARDQCVGDPKNDILIFFEPDNSRGPRENGKVPAGLGCAGSILYFIRRDLEMNVSGKKAQICLRISNWMCAYNQIVITLVA